jgi:hypothetical protein
MPAVVTAQARKLVRRTAPNASVSMLFSYLNFAPV